VNAAYQAASCQYGIDDGGLADPHLARQADVRRTYFNKTFDFAPIAAVLGASIRETVDFIESQGVRVFRTESSVTGCRAFADLPQAPADFQAYWDRTGGRIVGENAGSNLIGLYVERASSEVPSAAESAEIGIREDASRWQLVHEFMHHQFERQAARDSGRSASQVKQQLKAWSERLEQYIAAVQQGNRAPETLANEARSFIGSSSLVRQLLLRFVLEEMTIESFLQDLHASGALRFAPVTREASQVYIDRSAEKARGILHEIGEYLAQVRGHAAGIGADAELRFLDDEAAALNSLGAQISEVQYRRGATPAPARFSGAQVLAASSADRVLEVDEICARSQGADEALAGALRAMRGLSR
jgi:hypothetical protein